LIDLLRYKGLCVLLALMEVWKSIDYICTRDESAAETPL